MDLSCGNFSSFISIRVCNLRSVRWNNVLSDGFSSWSNWFNAHNFNIKTGLRRNNRHSCDWYGSCNPNLCLSCRWDCLSQCLLFFIALRGDPLWSVCDIFLILSSTKDAKQSKHKSEVCRSSILRLIIFEGFIFMKLFSHSIAGTLDITDDQSIDCHVYIELHCGSSSN